MDEINDTVNVMINNAINQTIIIINDWITNTIIDTTIYVTICNPIVNTNTIDIITTQKYINLCKITIYNQSYNNFKQL